MKKIGLSILLIVSVFALSLPLLVSAEQIPKELPKALGLYLNSMEGLIKWEDMSLGYKLVENTERYFGYKKNTRYPFLNEKSWSAPKVKNVSGQELSMISYFTLGTKDPERFKLYRLRTGKDIYPYIMAAEEISLSVAPITGVPGLMGNMVQIVPDRVLTKGNYIFTESDLGNRIDRCWAFTVDGGEALWKVPGLGEQFLACLCAWCGIF